MTLQERREQVNNNLNRLSLLVTNLQADLNKAIEEGRKLEGKLNLLDELIKAEAEMNVGMENENATDTQNPNS